ncbi:hypothetical protein ACLB9X_04570 [Streptomyces sp. 5K101]|uniref:hypothetical protein n=1 Tax=Streptomyces sp. 5K101 TaxID=3390037 RepID=UPI0039756B35
MEQLHLAVAKQATVEILEPRDTLTLSRRLNGINLDLVNEDRNFTGLKTGQRSRGELFVPRDLQAQRSAIACALDATSPELRSGVNWPDRHRYASSSGSSSTGAGE